MPAKPISNGSVVSVTDFSSDEDTSFALSNESMSVASDSFASDSSFSSSFRKFTMVCKAHKNDAADITATLSSTGDSVVSHGTQIIDHTSRIAGITSALVPIGSVIGAGINLVKDVHVQNLIEARMRPSLSLYHKLMSEHLPNGFSPRTSEQTMLRDLHEPLNHSFSTTEVMLQTLEFALTKMASRIVKLEIQQIGSEIIMAGTVGTVTGACVAGVGAIPGIIVAGVGSAVNLAPTAHSAYRAIKKKKDGTKGVDRTSSTKFIWGFALQKAIRHGLISISDLRDEVEAMHAFTIAEDWKYLRRHENNIEIVQDIAHDFLECIDVISFHRQDEKHLTVEQFTTKEAFDKIMKRLKSTPSV